MNNNPRRKTVLILAQYFPLIIEPDYRTLTIAKKEYLRFVTDMARIQNGIMTRVHIHEDGEYTGERVDECGRVVFRKRFKQPHYQNLA